MTPTHAQLEKLSRVADTARAFASAAAEFLPDQPEAVGEHLDALADRLDEFCRDMAGEDTAAMDVVRAVEWLATSNAQGDFAPTVERARCDLGYKLTRLIDERIKGQRPAGANGAPGKSVPVPSRPSIGRIVHYVATGTPCESMGWEPHRAALVIGHANGGGIHLLVWNVGGDYRTPASTEDPTGQKPGSWHWPERG